MKIIVRNFPVKYRAKIWRIDRNDDNSVPVNARTYYVSRLKKGSLSLLLAIRHLTMTVTRFKL